MPCNAIRATVGNRPCRHQSPGQSRAQGVLADQVWRWQPLTRCPEQASKHRTSEPEFRVQIVAQAPNLQDFRLASSRVGPQGGIAIASALAKGAACLLCLHALASAGPACQLACKRAQMTLQPSLHSALPSHSSADLQACKQG